MTTAIRHNSSFGVRNPVSNGRDGAGPKGKLKREVVSFKDSSSNDRRSTSGSSGRIDGKHEYTLINGTEQTCNLLD